MIALPGKRPYHLLLAALLWGIPVPAAAQVRGQAPPRAARPAYAVHPGPVTSAKQAAARAAHRARGQGRRSPSRKAGARMPELGDTRDFNTRRFLDRRWHAVNFTLLAMGEGYHLWVETAERDDGRVTDDDVAALSEALGARTPAGSVDPNAGILANNRAFFGEEPDFDGDGAVDILWFDIGDDFPSAPPLVAYVAEEDYDPGAPDGVGNQADVLYLDTDPLLIGEDFGMEVVQAVAAGIHQALIHFNYDPDELPFIRTGLFEWAKGLNGYETPGASYLQQVAEHNVPLFSWGGFAGDVERAYLFLRYLTDQHGRDAAGRLTRASADGPDGVQVVLDEVADGRLIPDFVFDFHTANLVNDPALDARLGYADPALSHVAAVPSRSFDAGAEDETPPQPLELAGGGVQYLRWENVADLDVLAKVVDPTRRNRVFVRAVVEALDGSTSVVDLSPGDETTTFAGRQEQVTLVVVDAVPEEDTEFTTTFVYAAAWTGPAVAVMTVAYDNGLAADPALGPNFARLDLAARQATRFAVPEGARPGKVFVTPYYVNQFLTSEGPLASPTDPRDFTLAIRADDGAGRPGPLLFSRDVDDPRPFFFVTSTNLNHFAVDLVGEPALADLPEAIHVELTNAGEDENALVLAVATYAEENVSFVDLDGTGRWTPLWNLEVNGRTLANRAVPIRVQFRLPEGSVDAEEAAALPAAVVLHPNYPNPFNPATTIRYEVPAAAPVRLAVFDVLGRRMAVLVDGWQPAGTYAVPLNAAHWAGGVYFYTLEAGGHRRTRMMTLVK